MAAAATAAIRVEALSVGLGFPRRGNSYGSPSADEFVWRWCWGSEKRRELCMNHTTF